LLPGVHVVTLLAFFTRVVFVSTVGDIGAAARFRVDFDPRPAADQRSVFTKALCTAVIVKANVVRSAVPARKVGIGGVHVLDAVILYTPVDAAVGACLEDLE